MNTDVSRHHLAVSDLHVSFNGFQAVKGMNLSVSKGELRCLIGPNGAGKTTCLDLICGRTKPTSGSIVFKGHHLEAMEEYRIARTGVGRKFQVPSVFKELTVRENLEVAYCKQPGVLRNLSRAKRSIQTEGLESLGRFVDLADRLDEPAAYLSHGQTQWLEIALLLAQDAELILLDEPAAGMTHQETRKTADILNRLKGRHTLVVVEHDMGFVREIADCISVMHQGRLLAEGSAEEIARDPRVREAYLGSGGFGHA
jgi:urea transport system ATP-binding protein